jgi:probable F420-dependent oxidoreductase
VSAQQLRLGVSVGTTTSRREWQDTARRAEAVGFDILQVADHLDDCLPPLTSLCSAADVTERLRVGTLVVNNDFRHPVLLAREAATVALLSDGRFELGLGAGHMKREYDQAGLHFDVAPTRIARLAESVEIVRRLLEGEELTFHGAHYHVDGHCIYPMPAQRPPLLIGGNGDRLLAVAARQADIVGFTGFQLRADGAAGKPTHFTAAGLGERIAFVRERAGPRFDAIELHVLVQHVIVTGNRRRAAAELSGRLGSLSADQLLDSPFILIGTPEQMAETLRERSQRFGVNYWTVFAQRPGSEQTLETLAPVIALLR